MMLVPRKDWGMSLFDDVFDDPFFNDRKGFFRKDSAASMRTDIVEKDGKYELTMDLPGYAKEDINIEVENGYLTISASHSSESEKSDKKFVHKERYLGSCTRSFYIGEDIDEDQIKASFENGTLRLDFPKLEEEKNEKKRSITIE